MCLSFPASTVLPQFPSYEVFENEGSVQICVLATNVQSAFSVNFNTRDCKIEIIMLGALLVLHNGLSMIIYVSGMPQNIFSEEITIKMHILRSTTAQYYTAHIPPPSWLYIMTPYKN